MTQASKCWPALCTSWSGRAPCRHTGPLDQQLGMPRRCTRHLYCFCCRPLHNMHVALFNLWGKHIVSRLIATMCVHCSHVWLRQAPSRNLRPFLFMCRDVLAYLLIFQLAACVHVPLTHAWPRGNCCLTVVCDWSFTHVDVLTGMSDLVRCMACTWDCITKWHHCRSRCFLH